MSKTTLTHRWFILSAGPLISLAVTPYSNFDPINPIKVFLLGTISFYLLGLTISNYSFLWKKRKAELVFSCAMVMFFALTLFLSDAPFTQQFWGVFGRNTGFLTYFSLIMIFLSIITFENLYFYKKIYKALIYTSVPVVIYCFIQYADLDPINWSAKHVFATFGNTNFLSAFLGMSATATFSQVFNFHVSRKMKVISVLLVVIEISIIKVADSIQGILMFLIGAGLIFGFWIFKHPKYKKFTLLYFMVGFATFLLGIMGLLNKGIFSKFIYQPSLLLRADYWHAGFEMTLKHPFFGVGIDSYGDWYRTYRGSISTLRTDPERTANTAHNIFLDISSGSGVFTLLSYFLLILFGLFLGFRNIRKSSVYDPYFSGIFSCWIIYLVQALISINQVAVGIWGWIFTGLVFGYTRVQNGEEILSSKEKVISNVKNKKFRKENTLFLSTFSACALIVGALISFIPLKADSDFKSARNRGDLGMLMQSTNEIGATAFHLSTVISLAAENKFYDQAKKVNEDLIRRFPRELYGWRMQYALPNSSDSDKAEAKSVIQKLDPYNPNNPK